MKKALFIGHSFHLKTKSSQFFIKLLQKKYELTFLWFDPYTNTYDGFEEAKKKDFDMLFLWQLRLEPDFLNKELSFKKAFFVPMYDSCSNFDGVNFLLFDPYKEWGIVCFSKTMHEGLEKRGYNAIYIQYFPEPQKPTDWGDEESVFFWQRITNLNIRLVEKLLQDFKIKNIHIHKAIDPKQEFVEPSDKAKYHYTYSEWFDDKEEMNALMEKSAIYIAPRPFEGIGMSFLDAMANGRCVIAPNIPTMNEYIQNGVNGILYDYLSPSKITPLDIRELQHNALLTVQKGYKKWQKDQKRLFKWLEKKQKKIILQNRELPDSEDLAIAKKQIETLKQRSDKFTKYFNLLIKWLDNEIHSVSITNYFKKYDIHTIGIYGIGKIGKLFYDELKDSKDIKIIFGIDQSVFSYNGLTVYRPYEEIPKVDAIIVTTNNIFDDVKKLLEQNIHCPIINIDDIINDVN